MQKEPITVDIVSDVACPWCYIGKRRLQEALAEWKGAPIKVNWHPFELDPNIPEDGLDGNTYLKNKFGDLERTKEMTARLTTLGAEEGITFNFDGKWLAIKTLPLHQLLHVAGEEGFQDALKERFLNAYFTENLHLNRPEVQNKLMAEFGWEAEKTQKVVADENIADAVKQEIVKYQKMGVSGVPFFIINNTYGISGAQPSSVFTEAFQQIAPLEIIAEGDSCGMDGENC
jgi:predicted DsbA family dithiol-disulfide isomerase